MAAFYDCMSAVMTAIGRRITLDEFDALYTRLDDERGRLFAQGYPADWLTAARTVAQQIEIEKALAQRNVIRNRLVHAEGKAFIAAARQRVDAGSALTAMTVGLNTPIPGGRLSIAAEHHGLWTTSVGALLADLRRAGGGSDRLVKLLSDQGFELEIAKALRGEPAHEDARAIAGAIDRVREDLRRQENDAGGWRGRLDGYVTRQSHDSQRVRRAGYDRWRADVMPMLDADRTFGRQEELLAQLRLERGQVLQHRFAAAADLRAAREELKTANRLDNKATARGERLDAADGKFAAALEEGQREMGAALGRYMDLQERARGGPSETEVDAARYSAEQHDQRVAEAEARLTEARREARVALTRYMDLADARREGPREAAPLLGEGGRAEVTGRQHGEARIALNRARERVNELYDRLSAARYARDDAKAFRSGLGRVDVTGRQLTEARVALTRVRERLQELHRRASAGRGRSIESDARRQMLADWVEASAARADRVERGLALLGDLDERIASYEKRLQGPIDPDTLLRRIYNAIAADTWMTGKSDEFKGLLAQVGPGSIAKRRAAHRELHFKDAASEVAYMRRYGAGGLADGVLRDIEGAATAIALQRRLGNNPEAMFQLLRSELLKEAHDSGNNALARAVGRKSIDWQLAEVTGAARSTANPTIAAYASSIRAVQSMAKLGGALLSSFGDIATAAAELKWQGRGWLSSYADMFDGMLKGRRSGEKRIIADLLGVGFESLTGQVMTRLGGESAPPGGLSKASALFFRLNGLSWWTDTHKTTAGLTIARYYALAAEQRYGDLPAPTRRTLDLYGIKSADWEVMRTAAVHAAEDGTTFMTAEGVRAVPLDSFMTAAERAAPPEELPTERQLRERRDRLASAYAALVTDRVDYAIPTAGARENAMLHMGTERGDLLGEALRFVMQFKSFPVAAISKTMGREFYGGGSKVGGAARIFALAAQLAVFGYFTMVSKELIAGKNPRDPLSAETIAAALVQGGGMGIYGDFFFGEFNRFGRSALSTAAGPTLGSTDDLFELWAKARDTGKMAKGGDKYGADLAASSLRFMASNTPFASLFWLRPAINYLALYPVQEALNPGYLRRMERRIERENAQTFWLSPTEAPRL